MIYRKDPLDLVIEKIKERYNNGKRYQKFNFYCEMEVGSLTSLEFDTRETLIEETENKK